MKKKLIILASTALALSIGLAGCNNNPNTKSRDPFASVEPGGVTGVSLNFETYSLKVGKKLTLTPTIYPNDATNQNVTWKSSNAAIASVTDAGIVTGIKEGTATITVTTKDGGYTATCEVTVIKDEEIPYIPPVGDNIYSITTSTLSQGEYDASNDEYTFSINQNYKQIYVNAPDKTIIVELNGVTIENNENSPIYVADCDTIEISAKKETTNYVKDTRSAYTEDVDGQGKAAIYVVNGDLKLKGSGTLNVTGGYYNGIHGKDDVKIQKQTLTVNAYNHGIKGNDSVSIVSGIVDITCGGDALHTENSDISSKQKQRGNVTISGGTVSINSWGDAVDAAYNAIIEQTDAAIPTTVVMRTNKYSSYSGQGPTTSTSNFYLKMNSSTYANGNYTYAAYINNQWYKATYKGTQSSGGQGGPGGGGRPGGGGSTYYIYQLDKPNNATSFTLYRFQGSNVTDFSLENYNAKSDAKAFNNAYDMVQISVSGNTINFSNWSNYSTGNSNSADISAKGLKAENEVYVRGGTVDIKTYDDGIHANNDGTIENGSKPLGNVNISGGNLTIDASDDGIHADYTLNISGGTTEVVNGYEGLEANIVNISGGETYVNATDDGVNATAGKSNALVNVTGGFLDVTVPTNGDTDGIDSNKDYTQSGGTVIIKGPGNASSGSFGAAALDTDGNVTISKGTLIVFGGIEKTPSASGVTKTLCSSSTVAAGSHSVSFTGGTSYTTTLKNSSNGCVVYSELGTATLK